jgi:hypothetical protein
MSPGDTRLKETHTMTTLTRARSGPDWVIPEMPPGYQNRVAEIQRLTADLESMGRFGRLLWEVGPGLSEVVLDLLLTLKFEAAALGGPVPSAIGVRLDARRRLVLQVSASEEPVQKKSPDLTHVFQLLQEFGEDGDRVVLVTNSDPSTRPADRAASITPEALAFLSRMGAGHLTAPSLFAIWKLALQEPERARAQVERLHAQDGGTFQVSS